MKFGKTKPVWLASARSGLAFAILLGIGTSVGLGQTVQLPTFSNFSVNTTVSVPDRGSASLGGIGSSRVGSTSRGIPGLGRVPGFGNPFRARAIGRQAGSSQARVHATIIDHREWDAAVLAEAKRRRGERVASPDGRNNPPVVVDRVEARARFLTAHVGRATFGSVQSVSRRARAVKVDTPLVMKRP